MVSASWRTSRAACRARPNSCCALDDEACAASALSVQTASVARCCSSASVSAWSTSSCASRAALACTCCEKDVGLSESRACHFLLCSDMVRRSLRMLSSCVCAFSISLLATSRASCESVGAAGVRSCRICNPSGPVLLGAGERRVGELALSTVAGELTRLCGVETAGLLIQELLRGLNPSSPGEGGITPISL